MHPSLAAVLLAALLLAGCANAPTAPAEILIESAPPEEVRSNETVPAVFEPAAKTRGHIAGVVVDEAIRPIEGAKVSIPGMDLERLSDRDGSFGFVDLHPGPYFMSVEAEGFYPAEAVLTVEAEAFTRAKVVLARIPPPEPYRVMQQFEGYTELTSDPLVGYAFLCTECDFDFYVDRPGLHTVILEAVTDPQVDGDGFWHDLRPYDGNYGSTISSGTNTGPLRVEVRQDDLGDAEDDRFYLRLDPESFPAPQTGKRFQVFVTAFYNEGPPTGWSFVSGDT